MKRRSRLNFGGNKELNEPEDIILNADIMNIKNMEPGNQIYINDKILYKNKNGMFSVFRGNDLILHEININVVFEYFGLLEESRYADLPRPDELFDQEHYIQRCGKCKIYFSGPIIYREKKEQHYMGRVKYWCPVCKSWWVEKNVSWEILQGFERYQVLTAIRDVPGSKQWELLKYLNKNMCGDWYQRKLSRVLDELEQRNRIFSDEYIEYWLND